MENATNLYGDVRDCGRCLYHDLPGTQDPCCTCMRSCNFMPSEVIIDLEKETEKMSCSNLEELLKTRAYLSNSNNPLEQHAPKMINPDSVTPYRIWFNQHDDRYYTTVQWMDGTKTTVCVDDWGIGSQYNGFIAALAKKIFGTTTNVIKAMDAAIDNAFEPARRRAEAREFNKKVKKRAHELRMKEREDRIKCEMEQERIRREAQRRLNAEELNETVTKVLGNIGKALKGGKK